MKNPFRGAATPNPQTSHHITHQDQGSGIGALRHYTVSAIWWRAEIGKIDQYGSAGPLSGLIVCDSGFCFDWWPQVPGIVHW